MRNCRFKGVVASGLPLGRLLVCFAWHGHRESEIEREGERERERERERVRARTPPSPEGGRYPNM